jgi:O-acetyl-ADP-ribose deacetylase (regulator of RNase III)
MMIERISIIQGDILNADADVICHQVNCRGVMGSGLARQIRSAYPDVFQSYRNLCQTGKTSNLGHVQFCQTPNYIVANLFAQDGYGTDRRYTDYNALRQCLCKVAVTYLNNVIALPYGIGCGLAGGDWNGVVLPMIKNIFSSPSFSGKLEIYQL